VYVPVNIPAIILASSPRMFSGDNITHDKRIQAVVAREPITKRLIIGNPALLIELRLIFSNR